MKFKGNKSWRKEDRFVEKDMKGRKEYNALIINN